MKIHLHASCWNEKAMLPYFFRHYDPFVSRYFFYDNESDDGSYDLLKSHPRVTVSKLELTGDSFVEAAFERLNSLWWPSRGEADWVAVCNVDEFFWHHDLIDYLSACRRDGITFLQSTGYQMVSDEFPEPNDNLSETIRFGAPFRNLDKPAFFNPDAITDSGFTVARHSCDPKGQVVRPEKDEILLLHYKHLSVEYVVARHAALNERRRSKDVEKRYGHHYERAETLERHAQYAAEAQEIITAEEAANARRLADGGNDPQA